jgi:hypothetical protein
MKSFRGVEAGDGMRRREAELRQYTAFCHAPVGQKLLQAQPAITQESLAVGQNWAHTITTEMHGPATIRRLATPDVGSIADLAM